MGDRGVDLDRVDQLEVGRRQGRDRAADRRDDPDGERVLVAERAADRGDRLADDDVGGAAERQHRERVRGGRRREGRRRRRRRPSRRPWPEPGRGRRTRRRPGPPPSPGVPAGASPAFVITWAFVRIVPSAEMTKPEPWAPWPPVYVKTVTTPGERSAKIRAGEKLPEPIAGEATVTWVAAARPFAAAGEGARTTTVVELPTRPVARPMPSAAAAPSTAQTRARRTTRTGGHCSRVPRPVPCRFPVETARQAGWRVGRASYTRPAVAADSPAPERRRPRRGSLERPINGRLYRGHLAARRAAAARPRLQRRPARRAPAARPAGGLRPRCRGGDRRRPARSTTRSERPGARVRSAPRAGSPTS